MTTTDDDEKDNENAATGHGRCRSLACLLGCLAAVFAWLPIFFWRRRCFVSFVAQNPILRKIARLARTKTTKVGVASKRNKKQVERAQEARERKTISQRPATMAGCLPAGWLLLVQRQRRLQPVQSSPR